MALASLHDFMDRNRDEILAACIRKMKSQSPERSDEELAADFHVIIDEIVRALGERAGLPESSPLPGKSQAASNHGARRQRLGYAIEKIALDIGTISDSVGELATQHGLSFAAEDYHIFNQCIDTATASALEQFASQAHRQREDETTQRVGHVAHELRNALASARMSFAALKKGRVGINSKTGEVLNRGLGLLENLISELVLAVQLQAGVQPELRRLHILELLRDVEDATVLEKNVSVAIEAESTLEADGDERLLYSAVSNLVQNAIKFSRPKGHVVARARADGEHVIIEVEDECGGLPPGKAEELFEPYVQRSPDRRGLGLGLAITRDAINAHGGELSVRNLPGKGCVFTIKLHSPPK